MRLKLFTILVFALSQFQVFSYYTNQQKNINALKDSIAKIEKQLGVLKDSLNKIDIKEIARKSLMEDSLRKAADTIPAWSFGGNSALTLNQVSLANWAQGGESSYSGTVLFHLHANYKKGNTEWENSLDIGYGLLKMENSDIRKNEDKIDVSSKFGLKAIDKLFYTGLLNFKSQFDKGFNYPNDSVVVSKFFAPAYIYASVGMDYKPADGFSVYLSPASGRLIFVMDEVMADKGLYSVEKAVYDSNGVLLSHGKKARADFGASLSTRLKTVIITGINLDTKLDLFNNYTDKNKSNRNNIDINFETMLVLDVNKYIKTNFFLHLIYDDDINIPFYEYRDGAKVKTGEGPGLQVKETLGIGLSYQF